MRQIVLILAVLTLVLSLSAASLQLSKPESGALKISFNLPDFTTEKVLNEGTEVNKLKVTASEEEEWKENLSGLPQLESWVYIPSGFDAQISILNPNTQSYNNFDCFKLDDSSDVMDWLDVSQPMIFRGNRIVSFCVKPFQYDANSRQLITLSNADIIVNFTPNSSYITDERLQTPNTVGMLKSLCINRDDIRTSNKKPGSYVIIYNGSTITSTLQPYADWKREKGYEVVGLNTAINGNSTTAIKAFLQNAYDTWENPPEFIMIFGKGITSTNYVPTYFEYYHYNTVGDYQYTLLDGGDLIPDAYIGRITYSSTDELTAAINKMIGYEKMQGLSTTNWLSKYFLVGDPSDSGISCVTTANYIKGLIQDYNPSALITLADSGSFPSQINAALNAGVGAYFYRGHGDFSGWTTTDINNLNNIGKYFFFSYITCFSGNFGSSAMSQAERLTRLGTPSVPKGAIGVIAASCETHTCLNNILTGGTAYGLYLEGMTQGGPAMVRGKLALMANYPQNPANYINQYMQSINLLGDPGLDIWMKAVSDIVVTGPTELYSSGGNALVRVTLADGTPVESAWVSLFKNTSEQAVNGYTDENGWIVLPYGNYLGGMVKLTVTKPNHKTYQTSLIVNTSAPSASLLPITALQQCSAGSTKNFTISFVNNAAATMTGVSGTLESLNENVTVTQPASLFDDVNAGGTAASLNEFVIQISPETPKGTSLYFIFHLTSSQGVYDIPVSCVENGPDFLLTTIYFTNNLLNHGINLLSLTLQNNGSASVSGLQAILECTHPMITIQNPILVLGTVDADQVVSLPTSYVLEVSDSLAEGTNIRFYLQLHNSNGFVQMLSFDKKVGLPTDDDFTGPDSYGYVCYGPGDSEYIPYNWIEIDPTLGGTGSIISISDTNTEGSGSFQTITLPFQFRFYGRSYSQLTVCSNGFVMPGTQGSIEWMNWQIPGPMVPRPIIAPFWDDLLTDYSSRILYKYDADLNAEIIQWQNLKNKYSPSLRETFQVILYDPVYHSNPTGDSPILFQFKVFNNVDGGNYGVSYIDHGQYATIGIADHTGLDGIGYTFNNQYPTTAQILENLTTLYFTTLPAYQSEANLVVLSSQITEITGNNNGLADAGEQLSLTMTIKNIGLGYISESQVTLTSTDPYVTIIQNQADLQSLASNQIETTSPAFVIDIAQNCPNNHVIDLNLHVQNDYETFNLSYELQVNALQFLCESGPFIDNNNNFPEQGETGTLQYKIQNVSLLDAQNLVVSLDYPAGVTVNPPSQNINLVSQTALTVSFTVTFDSAIEQGSLLDIGLRLTITGVFDSLYTYPLLVGHPEVFLETGFEDVGIQQIFQSYYNVHINPSSVIHPSGLEAVFTCIPMNPYSYAFCYPMLTNDLLAARVKFTWQSSFSGMSMSIMALYPDQPNLSPLWTRTTYDDSVRTEYVTLMDFADYADYVALVFVANANSYDSSHLYLDDVSILTLRHAPGFISGHVNLDMHPELVTDVEVRIRYSNEVYHPDEQGDYLIPAYQGLNTVTAYLEGYISADDSVAVAVTGGQTAIAPDLSLQRLVVPINLSHSIDGNQLTLTWDVEGQQASSKNDDEDLQNDRFLVPDYFRISIRWNNFNITATSPTQTYTNTIQLSGSYKISIRSVYLFNGVEETFSNPSDTLMFDFTGSEDETVIPIVYALNQNYPNPFNPTTQISFSLPEASHADLRIYNLKGQVVKTLIQEELNQGLHTMVWNGKDDNNKPVSTGIYYYRLKWQGKELTRKMILLK